MQSNNSGFFGTEKFRENVIHNNGRDNQREHLCGHRVNLSEISPERWVDIICLTLIGVFLIAVACTWASFSEALFAYVLFPIIYVGSRIAALAAAIGAGAGLLRARFRRRRYWR